MPTTPSPRSALLAALLAGCAHRQVGQGEVVRRIRFEGNGSGLEGTGDFQVRTAMAQEQNPRFTWVAPRRRRVFLRTDDLRLDAWRIETWYAHHGYFDARFMGWDLVTLREGDDWRPPRIEVVGYVRQGEPSAVRSIEWRDMESLGAPLLALLRNRSALREGDRFDLAHLQETEAFTLETLRERAFARATVHASVEAFPEEHAVDVRIDGILGPPCVFGEVVLSGDFAVPEALVRDEIAIEPGKAWRASALEETRQRLFGLGIFSIVNVVPDLDAAEGNVIPVRVELAETRVRQLRLGGGVLLESGQQDVHVSADFRHVNLFRRLVGLSIAGQVGYTSLATLGEVTEDGLQEVTATAGPTTRSELVLTVPRFPARRWSLENNVSFDLGVEEGYRYWTPELAPTFQGRLSRTFTLGLGWHLRYFHYLAMEIEPADLRRTPLGLDFAERYLLSFLSQQVVFDGRDDVMFPRDGSYGVWELSEAGGPVGGDFNFLRLTVDQRLYEPLNSVFGWNPRGVSLAGRVGGGWIVPYGSDDRARVPYAERLYVGGSTTVRGWRQSHLGPYVCGPDSGLECVGTPGREQPTGDVLPIGGLVALYGGGEVRWYFPNDFGAALFSDLGMAWEEMARVWPIHLEPTVGAGARYKSAIGPARLDLGLRLGREPMFAQEPRFNVHLALSEAW